MSDSNIELLLWLSHLLKRNFEKRKEEEANFEKSPFFCNLSLSNSISEEEEKESVRQRDFLLPLHLRLYPLNLASTTSYLIRQDYKGTRMRKRIAN